MISCEFCEISKNTFFYIEHLGGSFWHDEKVWRNFWWLNFLFLPLAIDAVILSNRWKLYV